MSIYDQQLRKLRQEDSEQKTMAMTGNRLKLFNNKIKGRECEMTILLSYMFKLIIIVSQPKNLSKNKFIYSSSKG